MEPCLGFREITVGLEGSVYNGDFRNPLCIGGVGLLPAKGRLVSGCKFVCSLCCATVCWYSKLRRTFH